MFHPELRLLRCAVMIARERSVTRAAECLHLTQPTVSGQLKDLETQLGFPLFVRSTRSVEPTAELEEMLPEMRAVVEEADRLQELVDRMHDRRSKHFRLGAAMYSMDFELRLSLTEAFNDNYPEVSFTIDNRLQHQQIPDLVNGKLDLAFLLGIATDDLDPGQGAGVITNEVQFPLALERVVLDRRRMGLLVPSDGPLARGEGDLDPTALEGHKIAMLSDEHGSALIRPIANLFESSGATLLTPPEGNALAVERYAAKHNICGLETGWFQPLEGQTFRHVEGLDQCIEFSLVRGSAPTPAANRLFLLAQEICG